MPLSSWFVEVKPERWAIHVISLPSRGEDSSFSGLFGGLGWHVQIGEIQVLNGKIPV